MVSVIFNYGFYVFEFCDCFFFVFAIVRFSLLFRYSFSSNISMFLAVIGSIAVPFINVFFINIPTPPPSLPSLIFPIHLYPFTTMFSFCLRFVLVTAYRSHYKSVILGMQFDYKENNQKHNQK